MSGITGIVNLNGAPVDRELLWSMTRYLSAHGPDVQEIWTDGSVGLGNALLRTTPEASSEHQPCTLDGSTWITADCRVDAGDDLRRELTASGHAPEAGASDAQLILHAYAAWGVRCVDHLLGDFAFALWDTRRRSFFCVRDHFGVKPFFYAHAGNTLVFSNSLNAVRFHPAVSNQLDEVAIANFLMFDRNLEAERSSFSSIRRLRPAHFLRASDGTVRVQRYWEMPIEDEIHYRRKSEYVERFRELMSVATQDRLRTNTVSILMSGGLDSPTVAATARRLLSASGAPFELTAHTIVFDRIVPDQERKYSQLVADAIGIPIRHHPFDHFGFPPPEPEPDDYPPEPMFVLDRSRMIPVHRLPAADARVVLRADGADPLMLATACAPQRLIDRGQYWRVAKEYFWLLRSRRQIPYFGLRTMLRTALGRATPVRVAPFPPWLAPAFERRLNLRDRWSREIAIEDERPGFDLAHPYWSACFESLDPGSMHLPAEIRYPFLDLRLVRWALRVPLVPWAMEKSLLRVSMKGLLPAAVLRRRKAPVAGNPWAALLPAPSTSWWEPYMVADPRLAEFVDVPAATAALASVLRTVHARNVHADIDLLRSSLGPMGLNLWLRRNAS